MQFRRTQVYVQENDRAKLTSNSKKQKPNLVQRSFRNHERLTRPCETSSSHGEKCVCIEPCLDQRLPVTAILTLPSSLHVHVMKTRCFPATVGRGSMRIGTQLATPDNPVRSL